MFVDTPYQHIALDENNVPVITGTSMKVVELVLNQKAYGWSPQELQFQHPYLSMGQIYSALAYYADHQEELHEDIERRLEKGDELASQWDSSSLDKRLRSKGLIE
ncbi:MAG: DUF433 domain-containing protein [Ardenticatenaceae bacterium]|nr:DUF433 domain-containing protein [Ardenticatenaceae bacterium]